jgi:hypothetical protein
MKNNNKIFACLASCLAIILPVPGRIVFGIFVLIHFILTVMLTTLLSHAIRQLKMESLRLGIIALEITGFTVLYQQFLNAVCPLAAFTLGFAIYLPSISAVILTILSAQSFTSVKENLASKILESLHVSAFCIVMFILRDILGFGTVTLPVWKDIYVIKLPVFLKSVSFCSFFATVPGALIITVLSLFVYLKFDEYSQNGGTEND